VTVVTLPLHDKPDTLYHGHLSGALLAAAFTTTRTGGISSMTRRAATPLLALVCWAVPSLAYAADTAENEPVMWVIGVTTLMAAVVLLAIALGLARVAEGSAMAENISYVVAACVCLSGSVLATWAARFAPPGAVADQVAIGGQALVIAAITFFCIYFFRVRLALKRFLSAVSVDDALARAHMQEGPAAPSGETEGGTGERVDA
jgi:hypothetical protein